MPRQAFDNTKIEEMLQDHPLWKIEEDGKAICRTFRFEDFAAAFGFMAEIALAAEKLDHHPEWTNVWNRVSVRLTTHDAGGLTELDFLLAATMDRVAGRAGAKSG